MFRFHDKTRQIYFLLRLLIFEMFAEYYWCMLWDYIIVIAAMLVYNILVNYVDYFVICESKYDHAGKQKKQNFFHLILFYYNRLFIHKSLITYQGLDITNLEN